MYVLVAICKSSAINLENYTDLLYGKEDHQTLIQKIKSLTLENEILAKENNLLIKQQSTADIIQNRTNSLKNIEELEEEYEENEISKDSSLKKLKINNILSKGTFNSDFCDSKSSEEFFNIFYSLSIETIRDNIMQKRLLMPSKMDRKRNIFSKFTLSNVLNN